MIALLLKVTLLMSLAMPATALMRRATAATRHLICALALAGALLLPLTLLYVPHAIAVQLPVVFRVGASAPASGSGWSTMPLWALGTVLLLARLAIGYRRVVRLRRGADPTLESAPVFVADVSVPMVCGLLRPMVLLPRESDAWPLNQRAAAVRHEMAHVARRDLWTSLMAEVACAVYWFHPLVWLVARQLRHEQEMACDDAVLSAGFEPANYAEALVATARTITSTSLIGCHMMTHQTLKERIARLLDGGLPRTTSKMAMRFAAVAGLAAMGAVGLTYAQQEPEKVLKMGPGISAPKLIFKVEPQYTDEAHDAKIQGTVLLSLVVGSDGVAHDINVVSTPDAGLGVKAAEAVLQWKFQPATKDGEAVAVQAKIEVNFKLK
jgi:TonB family protein